MGAGPAHIRAERRTLAAVAATTARFERELRGGDVHHLESGFIGCDEPGVRLGHKLFDSANGALCAAFTLSLRYVDLEARRALPMPATPPARHRSHGSWSGIGPRARSAGPRRRTNRPSSTPDATR